jgi:IclR family acetate operon transcriptional repressor
MATPGRPVAAVERALTVLEILADANEPLGVNEIARRLDVSASSASRLLGTLAAHGLVEKVPATGRFRLGVRLLQLGTHVLQRLDVRALARPLLEQVERATGETATLSLPAAGEGVTVDHVPSRRSVRSAALVGRPSVAHATAVGKVVLAFGQGSETELPTTLTAFTSRTITDAATLATAVAEVAQRGWGEADREREEDLAAIAVPVFDHLGNLVAVLGVQGPADRFDAEARRAALPAAEQAALDVGRLLGGDVTKGSDPYVTSNN